MKITARLLVRLYPRAWRERYGEEFVALIDGNPITVRGGVDVLRGAAREWLHACARMEFPRRVIGLYGLAMSLIMLFNLWRPLHVDLFSVEWHVDFFMAFVFVASALALPAQLWLTWRGQPRSGTERAFAHLFCLVFGIAAIFAASRVMPGVYAMTAGQVPALHLFIPLAIQAMPADLRFPLAKPAPPMSFLGLGPGASA